MLMLPQVLGSIEGEFLIENTNHSVSSIGEGRDLINVGFYIPLEIKSAVSDVVTHAKSYQIHSDKVDTDKHKIYKTPGPPKDINRTLTKMTIPGALAFNRQISAPPTRKLSDYIKKSEVNEPKESLKK